jgi:hypothetical protein
MTLFLPIAMIKTKWGLYLTLATLILGPVVLLLLPKGFFNDGPPMCPSMLLLGEECPGCGITRAVMHLIHLDIEGALFYNTLSFIVLPVMIGVWVYCIKKIWAALKAENTTANT